MPPPARPAPTLEDLPPELWTIIVNVFLLLAPRRPFASPVRAVRALSEVSRACRLAAHTLRFAVRLISHASVHSLRAMAECGAWPRVAIEYAHVRQGKDFHAELLRAMAALGLGLATEESGLRHYLAPSAGWCPAEDYHKVSKLIVSRLPSTYSAALFALLATVLAETLTDFEIVRTNEVEQLPESIGKLTRLTSLSLWGCYALRAVPESIGQLSALTSLNLSKCEALVSLPEGMAQLRALTTLCLRDCRSLQELPARIGQLDALTSLDLCACWSLVGLPESIVRLKALAILDLSHCRRLVALFDPSLGEPRAAATTRSAPRSRTQTTQPASTRQLQALSSLNLKGCISLEVLPDSLGQLGALTALNVSGCSSLVALPESLGQLRALCGIEAEEMPAGIVTPGIRAALRANRTRGPLPHA